MRRPRAPAPPCPRAPVPPRPRAPAPSCPRVPAPTVHDINAQRHVGSARAICSFVSLSPCRPVPARACIVAPPCPSKPHRGAHALPLLRPLRAHGANGASTPVHVGRPEERCGVGQSATSNPLWPMSLVTPAPDATSEGSTSCTIERPSRERCRQGVLAGGVAKRGRRERGRGGGHLEVSSFDLRL